MRKANNSFHFIFLVLTSQRVLLIPRSVLQFSELQFPPLDSILNTQYPIPSTRRRKPNPSARHGGTTLPLLRQSLFLRPV
jgi:hypothetical protein